MLELQDQCQRQHQKSNGFWTDPKASTLASILSLTVSTSISFVFDVVERLPSKTKCLSACQHCTLLDMFVTAGDESLLDSDQFLHTRTFWSNDIFFLSSVSL